MEIWKKIEGFENYEISNFGRVKSLERFIRYTHAKTGQEFYRHAKERILKNKPCRGYNCVILSDNNTYKNFRVCRLVAIHFIENYNKKEQVNHIDGNKKNDCVYNLEWCTPKENMKHAKENNLIRVIKGAENYNSIKVICTETNKVFDTIGYAAEYVKLSPSQLSRILRGIYTNNTTLKLL